MLNRIKSYMMPIAMAMGIILHKYMNTMSFLTPYLIVIMLLITYCNISLKNIRFTRLHLWLILIQTIGSIIAYILLLPVHPLIAQGAMVCIFAPTATSAPVITGMLGGNVASLTAYSLLSNMVVVIIAPIIFSFTGEINAESFSHSVWIVFQKVFLLLFLPFFGALVLQKYLPRVHYEIQKAKGLSFYLWSIALIIITGKTVQFILDQKSTSYIIEVSIALSALILCVSQFLIGRRIGSVYKDTVAGGQGLGQKNTILAIWMAQTYLNPISSIGPGAYVLWQNIVNSYQVWRNRKSM
ncbi:transporter [Dysgonomonas sp. Marseille-P4677]|uniref:transporter n=1 Tax=Dysgonomonas sp. Marseille-P4677 TaxID=2364790 RepID=UPI001913E40E|nr:transporter [Dysgonomonas sp. Marseille-P4677]MBK5721131.1 transporter [Dysgonomonas sp. Marseille-P4677]